MRSRPNNHNKNITRTKSPLLLTTHTANALDGKTQDKLNHASKNEIIRMGSADVKLRMGSPDAVKQTKRNVNKVDTVK